MNPSVYVELKCLSHYSFLRGASHPHELIRRAVELGYSSLALTDYHGVYGLPKAFLAAKEYPGFNLISGAQVRVQGKGMITLLSQSREAYGLMCRILTQSHEGKEKGDAFILWSDLLSWAEHRSFQGLILIPDANLQWDWSTLKEICKSQVYFPLSRFLDGQDHLRNQMAQAIFQSYGIPFLATNEVHYHDPYRGDLQDVLTSIRERIPLKNLGYRLFSNHERYLKSPLQMQKLFSDCPEALRRTLEIAERCHFSLSELRYFYPTEWIPQGHTAQTYLESLVKQGAQMRYPHGIPSEVQAQLEHELRLIQELRFADYFLTIWEIVEFAKSRKILCQGRGSAANSAICYVLGITAIDPVRMNLLFERFISAERGEPPDIDVDFEHERREEVIQHIYEKYGRDRAAMVSAVITYRSRSAIREVTQAFGSEKEKNQFVKEYEAHPCSPELALQKKWIDEIIGFPRHLSIHSGGFTLSARPMLEIVPIEPARMPGRTIIQWDKYDLDALGLLKVDLLSLGMLSALRKTLDQVGGLALESIPPEDPKTYQMIRQADTVGTFQIESRAQMAMLPRLLPENFYDLVVEVALVRPGPIVGKMVHPYLRRKKGLEPIALPDPRLEPILGRTLGVPIFQEQVMKMAMILADFTPGEADQLRRAIGAWKSSGSIDQMGKRLQEGLKKNGIPDDFSNQIFQQIQGFSEYGFPESHAASFALIAYASAYLKCHYPAEFTCALLNSQPMGFYAPHTLVDDAKRHGVRVEPLHVNESIWDCQLVSEQDQKKIRIGFRYVKGVGHAEVKSLIDQRSKRKFESLEDFLERSQLRRNTLTRLAQVGAYECWGYDPRSAIWRILEYWMMTQSSLPIQLNLFSGVKAQSLEESSVSFFKKMDELELIQSDYQVYQLSTRGHPMEILRKQLSPRLSLTTQKAKELSQGQWIQIAGLAIVIQRPPTAAGTVFATIEDEKGLLDLIIHAQVYEAYREVILESSFVLISGRLQKDGQSVSLIVRRVQSWLTW